MSKELTEQWREGKLPDGAYYILVDKYEQNEPEIEVGVCYNSNFAWWIVKEVLAPVPTYEECVKEGTWYTEKSHNELLKKIEELEQKLESETLAKQEGVEIVVELEQKIHILNEANMNMENTVGKLGEQLNEANEVIKKYADGTIYLFPTWYNGSFKANNYLKKWSVK